MMERLVTLDKRLQYNGVHTLRWTLAVIGVTACGLWLFKEEVSSGVGEAASDVTRRTLEDEGVQAQAHQIAKSIVYQLLNDRKALDLAAQFLSNVVKSQETTDASLVLVQDVLSRPQTEKSLRELMSRVLTHPETAAKAGEFLTNLVSVPETRDALVTVLTAVLNRPESKQITSEFFSQVMHMDSFQLASNRLGNETVYYLLHDEQLRQVAVQWCNNVLNDPALQNSAGDAVWAAVRGAFVPWGKRSKPPMDISATNGTNDPVASAVGASNLTLPSATALDAAELAAAPHMTLSASPPAETAPA